MEDTMDMVDMDGEDKMCDEKKWNFYESSL